tara:strand:- start:742 stop:1017 length:276 start_codon:yes stop_codon:yes gene_type:complete
VNLTPIFSNLSILGVLWKSLFALGYLGSIAEDKEVHPWSSVRIKIKFGDSVACTLMQAMLAKNRIKGKYFIIKYFIRKTIYLIENEKNTLF